MITYYEVFNFFEPLICFFKLEDAIDFVHEHDGVWLDVRHHWL